MTIDKGNIEMTTYPIFNAYELDQRSHTVDNMTRCIITTKWFIQYVVLKIKVLWFCIRRISLELLCCSLGGLWQCMV